MDSNNVPWYLVDNLRGFGNGTNNAYLYANSSNSEFEDYELFRNTGQGFQPRQNFGGINENNRKFLYMAIRRGPMAVPENASDVFNTSNQVAAAPAVTSGFVTDALLRLRTLGGHAYPQIYSRLTGIEQLITQTNGVSTTVPNMKWDYMNGAGNEYLGGTTTTVPTHMWRRAPGYFDVEC